MRIWYVIATVFFLWSCSSQEANETKPEGVLDGERLTALLVDLQQIEGANNLKYFQGDTGQANYGLLYETMFTKHETTKAQFDSSMAWYAVNPEEMELIYDNVIEELMKMDAEEANQK